MRKLITFLFIILLFSFSLNKYNPIKDKSPAKEKKTSSNKPCIRMPCMCIKAPCRCPCIPKLPHLIKPSKSTKVFKQK